MKQEIDKQIEAIEQGHDVRIVYACESGSRAWGFASPDSDYDVRFIYIQPRNNYLSIYDRRDVIELPVNEILDVNGWDIRKALQLFVKSNGPLYEWLQSPIVYKEETGFAAELRELMPVYFSHPSGCHHYLSMALPKGLPPLAVMHFNKDGYSLYCREYKEYWEWVEERNEERYQSTLRHGRNYDAKNMMHTFRLLAMAEEIATRHQVIVHRPDRDFLLRMRAGEFTFEDLMPQVEEKLTAIESLYAQADLPEAPETSKAEDILIQIRTKFYE